MSSSGLLSWESYSNFSEKEYIYRGRQFRYERVFMKFLCFVLKRNKKNYML